MEQGAHPLAEYVDRIDPSAEYTVRTLAELMDLAPSSVSGMATYGWLPGSRMRPHARGGRQRTWTGRQLRRMARRPMRLKYDHDRYAPATLYRVGCRCATCVQAHNATDRERRRALAEANFGPEQRERLIALVAKGASVGDAAVAVGVTVTQVYGRATWDAAFGESLDEAGWSLCVLGEDDPLCSSPAAYRGTKARPACRGTGCREWRRDTSQAERAAAAIEASEGVPDTA